MGYTHYWQVDDRITGDQWLKIVKAFLIMDQMIQEENDPDLRLANERGEEGTFPTVEAERIAFNGSELNGRDLRWNIISHLNSFELSADRQDTFNDIKEIIDG
ncbi:MAG: hypothetical protein H8D23_29265 [Candidatus Brocadiales bacterium]|nr:hypothetical protein [Candidatus Brocadiales bacterium]